MLSQDFCCKLLEKLSQHISSHLKQINLEKLRNDSAQRVVIFELLNSLRQEKHINSNNFAQIMIGGIYTTQNWSMLE